MYFLKACPSTLSSYEPEASEEMAYSPCSPVSTLRDSPVAVFVRVTVRPGMTAPLISEMVPRTDPRCVCANTGIENKRDRTSRKRVRRVDFKIQCSRSKFWRPNECTQNLANPLAIC